MKAGHGTALALAVGALAVAAIPASAADDAGPGPAAKRGGCQLSTSEQNGGLGASYVYSLKVRNLSCDRGKKLVRKFHQCRHDNGGRNGKCKRVKGFRCKQRKLDSSPTLLQAKAKCVKGSQKFVQTFGETR